MALSLSPTALLGALSLAVSLAMAAVVYLSGPTRAAHRFLALSLFFEGGTIGVDRLKSVSDSEAVARGFAGVYMVTLLVVPWLYLLFIGAALDTPWVRPLRAFAGQTILVAAAIGSVVFRFVSPQYFEVELIRTVDPFGYSGWQKDAGAFELPYLLFAVVVMFFGLAAAVSAYRRAPNPLARRQAKAYLVAFGFRDAALSSVVLAYVLGRALQGPTWLRYVSGGWGPPLIEIGFVLLVTYGIMRSRLLDIDLKVRFAIKQTTIGAIFVAVFFVASESVALVLGRQVGPFFGIVAAGLLLFALLPLQRMAERFAVRVTPQAKPVEAFSGAERVSFYREQARIAWRDGRISAKERAMLVGLRAALGIRAEEAERVELEAAAA